MQVSKVITQVNPGERKRYKMLKIEDLATVILVDETKREPLIVSESQARDILKSHVLASEFIKQIRQGQDRRKIRVS